MNETGVSLTREQILAFREWMFSKADDPGRGSMVYAVCDLALAQSADSLLAFQSAILRETTAHRHRMDEQLYPLREVARVADLVWRGAVRCQTDEENYFRISPMDMEWLATALTKVKAPAPAREDGATDSMGHIYADLDREELLATLKLRDKQFLDAERQLQALAAHAPRRTHE